MNPYLKKLREQFAALDASMADLQTRAATEQRELTEDERTLVRSQAEQADSLAEQIRVLTEQENRSADVAEAAAALDARAEQRESNTSATDRDPGHYRSADEGGTYSFFGDIYRANTLGDDTARQRLSEHARALDTGTEGVGLVAPHWMTELYAPINRQGRYLANAVRPIPLGSDPRPITIPKQTVGTDAEVVEQANENDATEDDDAFDTDVSTVTPKPTTGIQIVSRQMLDMASPAIDQLIYGDMIAAYDLKLEKKIGAAMIAAGTVVTTFATNAAFVVDDAALDAVVDAAIAVRDARKLPADIIAMGVTRYGVFLKLKDADGRPLIVANAALGPVNAMGMSGVANDGVIEGLKAIPTDGVSIGAFPDNIVVAYAKDTLLFESNLMRFRYEEPLGPESIKLGIWGYTAVHVRYAGSVRLIRITAAA